MLIWAIIYGIFTLAILLSQHRLQRLNFRLALYDKRYAVFLSAMEYISNIVQKGRAEDEELQKLLRNSKDKEFLFGTEVGEYIELLYKNGVKLKKVDSLMETENNHERRNKLADDMFNLTEWFSKQFEEGKKTFEAYLAIRK